MREMRHDRKRKFKEEEKKQEVKEILKEWYVRKEKEEGRVQK